MNDVYWTTTISCSHHHIELTAIRSPYYMKCIVVYSIPMVIHCPRWARRLPSITQWCSSACSSACFINLFINLYIISFIVSFIGLFIALFKVINVCAQSFLTRKTRCLPEGLCYTSSLDWLHRMQCIPMIFDKLNPRYLIIERNKQTLLVVNFRWQAFDGRLSRWQTLSLDGSR